MLPFSQLGGILAGARSLRLAGLNSLPVAATLLKDLLLEQLAKVPYVLAGLAVLLLGGRDAPLRLVGAALAPLGLLVLAALLGRARFVGLLRRGAAAQVSRWPALAVEGATSL